MFDVHDTGATKPTLRPLCIIGAIVLVAVALIAIQVVRLCAGEGCNWYVVAISAVAIWNAGKAIKIVKSKA